MSILLVSEKFVSGQGFECIPAKVDVVYPDNSHDCFDLIIEVLKFAKENGKEDIVFVDIPPIMAVSLANFTKLYKVRRRIGLYVKPGVVEWFD